MSRDADRRSSEVELILDVDLNDFFLAPAVIVPHKLDRLADPERHRRGWNSIAASCSGPVNGQLRAGEIPIMRGRKNLQRMRAQDPLGSIRERG